MLLLGTALLSCRAEPRAAARPPRLVIDEATHDFGRAAQGTIVRHVFEVANDGGLELEILRLRSTNDCPARLRGPAEVAAGQRTAIEAAFDTGGVFGPVRRSVTLYSNDPSRPVLVLELTGEIELEAAVRPAELYVGKIRRGERSVREITVFTAEGVRIEGVESNSPHVAVEVLAASGTEHETRVAVSAARAAPPGRFEQEIRVRTSSRRFPLLVVPVTGTVSEAALPPEKKGD